MESFAWYLIHRDYGIWLFARTCVKYGRLLKTLLYPRPIRFVFRVYTFFYLPTYWYIISMDVFVITLTYHNSDSQTIHHTFPFSKS